MAAPELQALYASMPDRLAQARRKLGRELTLAEKIIKDARAEKEKAEKH